MTHSGATAGLALEVVIGAALLCECKSLLPLHWCGMPVGQVDQRGENYSLNTRNVFFFASVKNCKKNSEFRIK